MKCWNSAFNAQGSRVIILVVHVGVMKIYVAVVRAGAQEKRKHRMKLSLPQASSTVASATLGHIYLKSGTPGKLKVASMCNVYWGGKYNSNFGQAIVLLGRKYALERKVGQQLPIWVLLPFQNGKIQLDWSGICEWCCQIGWEAAESLVPSPHRVPSAVEHCRVILCVNVLLEFNLDSVFLTQLHVISLHILNLARWPEP